MEILIFSLDTLLENTLEYTATTKFTVTDVKVELAKENEAEQQEWVAELVRPCGRSPDTQVIPDPCSTWQGTRHSTGPAPPRDIYNIVPSLMVPAGLTHSMM